MAFTMWPFGRRTDEDFEREIDTHLAIEIDRLIAEGMSPGDARHAAARAFGNVARTQERFYESRRVLWLHEIGDDIRYAVRAFRRSPGFAAVAILTLALGIGANTAIFSVVNAVILEPLPYREPAALVMVQTGAIGLTPGWVMPAWRERAAGLTDLAGFNGPRASTLVSTGVPAEIDSADVTWNFLSFLGVPPAMGRDFTEADAARGAPPAGLLSHDLWMTRFGGDASVVGRTITVNGASLTVVGVAGSGFRFPTAGALPAYGLPIDMQPDVLRVLPESRPMNVLGRLAPGVSAAAATAELLAIYTQAAGALLDDGRPEFSPAQVERLTLDARSLQERLAGNVPERLWLTMGAVMFVLLIACANVANLLLARASTRQRELALRAALGARRGRLARLVLAESVTLALLGAAAGLILANSTRGIVRTLLADRVPHVAAIAIDWPVMAFTIGVATLTGMLCGLASLPSVRRVNLAAVFSDSGTGAVTGRSLTRRALLSIEVAVTCVLVVGAALFAQTLWNLTARDKGFDPDRMMTVRVSPGIPAGLDRRSEGAVPAYWARFFADLRTRLERIPGVESAGAISLPPLAGTAAGLVNIAVDGRTDPSSESRAAVAFVTPGYFRTMRTPIVRGRDFEERDRLGVDLVAIVNETFERRFAPNRNIVGARVTSGSGPEVFTIVGVMQDVPDWSLREAPEPQLIAPLAQMPGVHISWGALTFVLRTADEDPLHVAPEVRRAVWAINPNIVISEIATMRTRVAVGMRSERDSAVLFGMFAVAALVMAAIGVYGVAAYAIAQRTREIGIRVALGAAKRDVSRLVLSQTVWPTAIGIAAGLGGAAIVTRSIAALVFGVAPLDPATFAATALVLAAVALAGTWVPTRRATRIDPLVALRYE
jgi:putative ABC transport system permease protein